jgi:RNA polymerase sigma-70 factor, ECF subfamily
MPFTVVEEIDAQEATIVSFRHAATEEELVAAAKNGDEQAFEILVKRYEKRVFSVAQRYTRANEDAKDVVQQTFQNAFVHLRRFERKSLFSTWLTRIAINEALMLLRRRRALREVPVDESSDLQENSQRPETCDPRPNPEADYTRREQVRLLFWAVRNLKPRLRRAVELREIEELSTSETARRLGLSVGTVKAQLFRAKRKLRQALARYLNSSRTSGNDSSDGDSRSIPSSRLRCISRN